MLKIKGAVWEQSEREDQLEILPFLSYFLDESGAHVSVYWKQTVLRQPDIACGIKSQPWKTGLLFMDTQWGRNLPLALKSFWNFVFSWVFLVLFPEIQSV